jgi:hypothetical protein
MQPTLSAEMDGATSNNTISEVVGIEGVEGNPHSHDSVCAQPIVIQNMSKLGEQLYKKFKPRGARSPTFAPRTAFATITQMSIRRKRWHT